MLVALLIIYAIALSTVFAAAFVIGGLEEKTVALALLVGAAATQVASLFGRYWEQPEWAVLFVDVALLAVLVRVAIASTRFWPIWAAAGQLAGVCSHLPSMIVRSFASDLYASTQTIWVVPIIAALGIGTWQAASRRSFYERAKQKRGGTA